MIRHMLQIKTPPSAPIEKIKKEEEEAATDCSKNLYASASAAAGLVCDDDCICCGCNLPTNRGKL